MWILRIEILLLFQFFLIGAYASGTRSANSELNDSEKLKVEISKLREGSDALQTELEAARQQISLLEEELQTKQLNGMHSNGRNDKHKCMHNYSCMSIT